MMVEVIEPNWHVFVTNMDSVSDFGTSLVSCAHSTLSVSLAVDLYCILQKAAKWCCYALLTCFCYKWPLVGASISFLEHLIASAVQCALCIVLYML